jgi:hypothetical protein
VPGTQKNPQTGYAAFTVPGTFSPAVPGTQKNPQTGYAAFTVLGTFSPGGAWHLFLFRHL